MSISRNDPCPCGSGEKYKKCCWTESGRSENRPNSTKQLLPFFSDFNTADLVKTFAALTILPENHGKNIRLENLTTEAIVSRRAATTKISHQQLNTYLAKNYLADGQEERPVNLFTDNIISELGNNIIFPGISEAGSFVLSNLEAAVFHWPGSGISEAFRENCRQASFFLLALSQMVAKRMGYKRYMVGTAEDSKIYIPNGELLEKAKRAVTFSIEEMTDLAKRLKVDPATIEKFLLKPSTMKGYDGEESPVVYHPIMFTGEEYIVISPATLSLCAYDYIWQEAERSGCMLQVNKAYHDLLWNNTNMELDKIGFINIQIEGIALDQTGNKKERLYILDEDKLAIVHFLYDEGENYSDPYSGVLNIQAAHERRERLAAQILAAPEFSKFKLLEIVIYSSIGRQLMIPYLINDHAESLMFSVFDVRVLAQIKDIDPIDLWKFALSIKLLTAGEFKLTLPQIDLLQVYRDHGDVLFLTGDEKRWQFSHYGDSVKLIHEAMLRLDEHAQQVEFDGQSAYLPLWKKDKYAPVYYAPQEVFHQLVLYVKGLPFPLSISTVKSKAEIKPKLRDLYFQFADAVAYWIWQASPFLAPHLSGMPKNPITIYFELLEEQKFEQMARDYNREPDLLQKIKITADKKSLTISIPPQIIPYLYGAENEGERVLLRALILGINELLSNNQLPQITQEIIDDIVEQTAPLGFKKKFFIVDSANNILFDPHQQVPYRYVQDHDVNVLLKTFTEKLGDKCPPPGVITDAALQKKLSKEIVMKQLLPRLKEKLAQYNSTDLLKKLIGLNESLIRQRQVFAINTPTRIACFVSVEQHTIDTNREIGDLDATTLATRCLIEHITAEPYTGNETISTTAVDELIALMNQIIEWGGIGDLIHYRLFDVKMNVYEDGWIEFNTRELSAVLRPFHDAKTNEQIDDAHTAFVNAFPLNDDKKGKDVPKYLDDAFQSEFGVTFTRICGFINALGVIAYKQDTPFAVCKKKELKQQVNAIEPAFNDAEFEAALNFLSLSNRTKVENIPQGYESFDISPWRMNRRLSTISKPLSIVDNPQEPDNPYIYWGLRQVSVTQMYLAEQCMSNRLRVDDDGLVKKAISRVNKEANQELVNSVFENLKHPDLIMDMDKFIGPGPKYFFQHTEDIGDIDVMIIDKKSKILYSLECKNLAPSRNFKEMVEEVNKMFDERLLDKHVERDTWIKANLDQFQAKYQVDLTGFTVKSIFVTAEEMLTPHLKNKKVPIPIITLYDIERNGLDALK